jgi:GNAT superfamily N-acetyltransferase
MLITIRPAGPGDEGVLASLNTVVQDLHCAERPDYFRPTHVGQMLHWYRERLEEPTSRGWIAEDHGQPVGYLLTVLHHVPEGTFKRAQRWLELDQIAVDPARRRHGIARALVGCAVDLARHEGVAIEATCWSFNQPAHALLQRLGFAAKIVRFELRDS